MKKTNILLITHERNMGGASKSLLTLASELQARGNQVIVVAPFRSGKVVEELKAKKIPVYSVFFGWWMMPEYWNPVLKLMFRMLYMTETIPELRIARIARKNHIEIVHSNSSAIDIGARVAQRIKVPHIWHFREFGDADYKLEYLKGKEKSCKYVNSIDGKVVFISKNLQQYYCQLIKENKYRVIYNGISKDYLVNKYDSKYNEREKNMTAPIVFLSSGNLQQNKRQDLILDAGIILYNRGYRNFKIIIAGEAADVAESQKYKKELQGKASRELPNMVEFTGYVKDMVSLRKKAVVELVCSSREAFGRVTVEAMMASNPVIGSDSGATPELITPGENGFLFREGDAESLAENMQKILDNPQLIIQMGRKAYEYASNNFPSYKNTESIMELYNQLT